jgi:hypothetical protein
MRQIENRPEAGRIVVGGWWLVASRRRTLVSSLLTPATSHQPLATSPALPPATSHQPLATARPRGRRGVLLLVVLSMLVLFSLIAVTFVLVSSQYRRSSTAAGRAEQYGDDYRRQLDEVFAQIVRDTTNTHSALQQHSLLNDIYGIPPVMGSISAPATPLVPGGQFLNIIVAADTFSAVSVKVSPVGGVGRITTMSDTPGYYNGCVFTVVFGDRSIPNVSARILGYTPAAAGANGAILSGTFTVMALDGTSITPGANPNDRFLVNGRPFTGAGLGYNSGEPFTDSNNNGKYDGGEPFTDINQNGSYDPGTGLLDLTGPSSRPIALLPHFDPTTFRSYQLGPDNTPNTIDDGMVSPNEEYDAPDVQNMMLGFVQINPAPVIYPSLHRPELINYWQTTSGPGWNNSLARQIMLRPMGPFTVNGAPNVAATFGTYDHPNFTGSNPTFDAVAGPWDVDNDGDGIADSVWVDVGMPVQTAPDGRRFKPLAATLCLDMDGRLNVNAHGSLAKTTAVTTSGPFAGSATNTSPPLPSGEGYGPADVDLSVLFSGMPAFQALLAGNSSSTPPIVGRYGETAGSAFPGFTGTDDPFSYVKQFEFPRTTTTIRTSYTRPPDFWARGLLGLDYRGQPLRYGVGSATYPTDSTDDPYELDLSRRVIRAAVSTGGVDNPFTVGELERILRAFDLDAPALPDRLRALLATSTYNNLRGVVTTDSYDLPVPSFRPTLDMILGDDGVADNLGGPQDGIVATLGVSGTANLTFTDLLKYRLLQDRRIRGLAPAPTAAQLNNAVARLLSPEIVSGQRMDINRPFGNGRDDDPAPAGAPAAPGYLIVDDPNESSVGSTELLWNDGNFPTGFNGIQFRHNNWEFDLNNDGTVDANDAPFDRQLLARQLYVLMMVLKDRTFYVNPSGTQVADTARAIAQWAVNVVDFRDADSIMTPFEYPINPFDFQAVTFQVWNVDNNPATVEPNRELVWGCERPELLITETLAFHDRRTEDLPNDNGTPPGTTTGTPRDTDFDQQYVPRGSLFVELYNPWTAAAPATGVPPLPAGQTEQLPAEFYYDTANATWSNPNGVLLNKLTPVSAGTPFPVWRLVVVTTNGDLNDPIVANRPTKATGLERSIYFTNSAPTGITTDNANAQYYTTLNVAPIPPGSYAAIGPSEPTPSQSGTVHHIAIGRNAGATNDSTTTGTRRIDLDPTSNLVATENNTSAGSTEPTAGDTKPAVAIVINSPVRLSVSEPVGGYGVAEPISPPADTPLDTAAALITTGTTVNYRTIHLQRLANPMLPWVDENTVGATTPINPYITIDTMPVDLTAFNGIANTTDPNDTNSAPSYPAGIPMFASRQRGEQNDTPGLPNINNLWRREPFAKTLIPSLAESPQTHAFPVVLTHSLGFLNKPYGPQFTAASPQSTVGSPTYLGDPSTMPFTWLAWNNRPFISPMELMLVPKSRPSQLTNDFTRAVVTSGPYTGPTEPYGHLLNFFQSAAGAPGTTAQFHRLFDYVQVPSRFVDAETVLNPSTGFAFGAATPPFTSTVPGFHPPFNRVSNYRDPGRININTISDPLVWTGLFSNGLLPGPLYATFDANRRPGGTGPATFANPYRAAGGVASVLPPTVANTVREADLTFLRSNPPTTGTAPLFLPTSATAYNEPNRNAYFRYQAMQNTSNSLTTRSNVYAVWITIGYFEVTPVGVSAVYPDGYQLGQEIGSDSGDVKRHRAFYIYDRSIPVGFEPGKDHNFDRGILLKRFIE